MARIHVSRLLPMVTEHPDWFVDPEATQQACKERKAQADDIALMGPDEFRKKYPQVNGLEIWAVNQGLLDVALSEVGIRSILGDKIYVIEYSGGGDSGQLDRIYIVQPDGEESTEEVPTEAHDLVEHIVDGHLEDLPDWYNNEGGGGQARLDTGSGELEFNHYQNTEEERSTEEVFQIEESEPHVAFVRRVRRHAPTAVKLLITHSYGDENSVAVGSDDRTLPIDISRIAGFDEITKYHSSSEEESVEIVIDLVTEKVEVTVSWTETIKGDDDYYSYNIYGDEAEVSDG